MARFLRAAFLPLLAVLAPAPAMAQAETAEPTSDVIVVQGQRVGKKQIDRFVTALTEAPIYGQIGRFEWVICPFVLGFHPKQNEAVARRLGQVAGAAGAPLAPAGCKPNMFVFATKEPPVLMAALRKKYPALFKDPIDQPVHITDGGSAVAWHIEGQLDKDGEPAAIVDTGTSKYYSTTTTMASRLVPPMRPHFLGGILVLDVDTLAGLTTTQVADYATMRLLARTDPASLRKAEGVPTILSILDAGPDTPVPVTLTSWDLSYLQALYGSATHRYATSQRHDMKRRMRKDVEASQGQN